MSLAIESNKDLPKCINTATKQAKKARELVTLSTCIATTKASAPQFHGSFQGFFSRTVIHDKELDDAAIFIYRMTCMPGKMWIEAMAPDKLITANISLGRVLARGLVEGSTAKVVDDTLRPHLELLLSSDDAQVRQFDDTTRRLLGELDILKKLPLWVAHFDLNDVNIMLDEHGEVSGLIDWELSTPLPFGMAFCRIHKLAGEYSDGEFYMPPDFERAERGFWDAVWNGLTDGVRSLVEANLEAVQTAVTLATLLDAFQQVDNKIGPYNPVVVKALHKHLTYRIPRLRGPDSPYAG
ncbi:hypothetical protein BKA81DRAFT_404273 [Phyllosticta paracitricarpa]